MYAFPMSPENFLAYPESPLALHTHFAPDLEESSSNFSSPPQSTFSPSPFELSQSPAPSPAPPLVVPIATVTHARAAAPSTSQKERGRVKTAISRALAQVRAFCEKHDLAAPSWAVGDAQTMRNHPTPWNNLRDEGRHTEAAAVVKDFCKTWKREQATALGLPVSRGKKRKSRSTHRDDDKEENKDLQHKAPMSGPTIFPSWTRDPSDEPAASPPKKHKETVVDHDGVWDMVQRAPPQPHDADDEALEGRVVPGIHVNAVDSSPNKRWQTAEDRALAHAATWFDARPLPLPTETIGSLNDTPHGLPAHPVTPATTDAASAAAAAADDEVRVAMDALVQLARIRQQLSSLQPGSLESAIAAFAETDAEELANMVSKGGPEATATRYVLEATTKKDTAAIKTAVNVLCL